MPRDSQSPHLRSKTSLFLFFFFTLFPPPFKISDRVKIAQWRESRYTETLSCQLSIEGDESEDKKVRGWPCVLGQREGFKVPVFPSHTRRVVGD